MFMQWLHLMQSEDRQVVINDRQKEETDFSDRSQSGRYITAVNKDKAKKDDAAITDDREQKINKKLQK